MDELERDTIIVKWTRHHGLRIPYRKWWGGVGHYEPDFLVELVGGTKELREIKGDYFLSAPDTTRKFRAGEDFCRRRGMAFKVVTKTAVDPSNWVQSEYVTIAESVQPDESDGTDWRVWLRRLFR